ncbi:MAG: T9SS type A sorting domain-containing protein [Bacteroidales bacterium]|nr:T9SS type A sorting domain-containing protein [Bacteroidales bacterium]
MSVANMRTAEFVDVLNAGTCAWEQDTMPYTNDGYPLLTMMITDANTDTATDLTAYSATLHGSVRVERATVVSKGFEYRAVGDSAYIVVPITQPTDTFSYLLNGLAINKNYEYRTFVKVAECIHTIYGEPQRFEISWLNDDTINIHDATMLRWVADKCNSGNTFAGKYIRLMNNIVLPKNVPNNMASIGSYPNYPFCGTFDGNGLLITNLYIDQSNTPYQGFFGYTKDAKLYEVGLVNITASGRNYTGGMVAYASNTTMRDCYVNGGTLFALSYCGGLVGYQDAGTASIISGCYNTCTVSGNNYVGGLVGYSNHATVRNSYVAAGVTAQGSAVGAIIGGADEVLMYNCWFNTNATGQSNAIGENNFKAGSEGMTDEEMRDPAFVATLNQGLSTPVWKSDYTKAINKGFPILKWQYSDAESCGAPENLSSSVNAGTITFLWSGGENAKSFLVEYGRVGDTAQQMQTTARQLQVNYQQGETYFWRVKSICSFGESGFVNGSNVTTGIAEAKAVPSLQIYPNPTDGNVTVSGMNCNRLQVSDIYGKVLGTFEANGETTVLDFSRYAAGVYVIRAWDGARMAGIGKVVKR